MKLEDQVASLELAKRLKALGVKQESLFVWRDSISGPAVCLRSICEDVYDKERTDRMLAAFTVAELGEILKSEDLLPQWGPVWTWTNQEDEIVVEEKTEADARAKMLVYLIENKLISVSDAKG